MNKSANKKLTGFEGRRRRVRAKIKGTAACPRLNVFRSLKHLFLQLIDDDKSVTLASVKDSEVADSKSKLTKTEVAGKAGELLAAKAVKLGIGQVVFDKSGYKYHGRVKAAAEGARKGGLKF